ncbi:MAG: maltose alpha-D-glucosyltransferase [Betaproteobacteria bacterium]|nr:maltose alpha-D-glucosyltransferase [Betaproteobacteria bacterium]
MIEDDPLWYKDAIIYELHVKAYFDSSGDGIGDFRGLTQKLDYIRTLGANTLWLLPFYPSPMRDDGYDISDYRDVYPPYGTLEDFRRFIRQAHARGLRVIIELVVNHTSDQHPWFQAARRAPPKSAKRSYYVWSGTDTQFPETRVIFKDTEASNWAWDPVARAYYWHRFFSHQPDLNHNNPHVVRAMMRVMRFWLDIGVDGLRLDAVPYLCVRKGTNNENLPETHRVIQYMRAELDKHYRNRMFLAEANQWPEDVREYFGDGDECHMAYHFPLMPRIYMAIAQEDRHPIVEILRQTPDIPDNCQWAIFLRNHDELTLEMVTDRERDYMYEMYAADERARLNLGIRRRLAPLMDNNRSKIELINSLLMSMPGSPIVYYGDEIGMGDNVYLGDRNGVRTPMQWSPDRNAGFSRADPARLYLPPIMDAVYGYEALNVEAQARNPSSLLNWTTRLITVRKAHASFGRGSLIMLDPANRKILAYLRVYQTEVILCVANLAHSAQPVELNLAPYQQRIPVELMGRTPFPRIGELPYLLTLPSYGFYWFELLADTTLAPRPEEAVPRLELPLLVLIDGWRTFLPPKEGAPAVRTQLERATALRLEKEVLPSFLSQQPWSGLQGKAIGEGAFIAATEWGTPLRSWFLTLVRAQAPGGSIRGYFVPLALSWDDGDDEKHRALTTFAVARVRQKARTGLLVDAFADDEFCGALVDAIGRNVTAAFGRGTLRCVSTPAFETLAEGRLGNVTRPSGAREQRTAILGDRLFLKAVGQIEEGPNPEIDIGAFLASQSAFLHVAPFVGSAQYHPPGGAAIALALLHAYIENQGTGWDYALESLERFLESKLGHQELAAPENPHGAARALMRTLGSRVGALHKAFCLDLEDPAFNPEPVAARERAAWVAAVGKKLSQAVGELKRQRQRLPSPAREGADELIRLHRRLNSRIKGLLPAALKPIKTRYHGNLHLGKVLVTQNDFVIIGFEGEPGLPPASRRRKHSPLRDVATMLRSFDRAAHAALARASAERDEDRPRIAPYALEWRDQMAEAFLGGYREGVQGAASYPEDETQADALIELFSMENACDEILREALRPQLVAPAIAYLAAHLSERQPPF